MSIASTAAPFERSITALGVIPRWVMALLVVDLFMGVANIATFVISKVLDIGPIYLFRVSNEANVPTWWSSAQLLLIGVTLSAMAYHRSRRRDRGSWALWLPAVLFIFLSLDEVASIHEHIGHYYGTQSLRTGMWVAICVPLFLIALVVVTRAVWPFLKGRTEVIRLFIIGLGIFLGSAVGIELLTNLYPDDHMGAHAINLVEEVGEMIGASVMLWAAVTWADSLGLRLKLERDRQPDR